MLKEPKLLLDLFICCEINFMVKDMKTSTRSRFSFCTRVTFNINNYNNVVVVILQVGAAISMTYTTGQPIVFVGTGQSYPDLKSLNPKSVVTALLK